MASAERSLGWATGVAGTDGATTYDTTRMISMERNTLGNGILLTGSYLTPSLTSSNTVLTIADGAAIVNGYFYESNGAVTIAAAGLAAGTYEAYIIANTSGGALTVSANGAGTATIAAGTTRVALITSAQYTTITTSITAANLVLIAIVTVAAGTFSALSSYTASSMAKQKSLPNTQIAQTVGFGANVAIANSAIVGIGSYITRSQDSDNGTMKAVFNGIAVPPGTYLVTGKIQWDTNATGTRMITIDGASASYLGTAYNAGPASAIVAFNSFQELTTTVYCTINTTIVLSAWQNSGASRTAVNVYLSAVKL